MEVGFTVHGGGRLLNGGHELGVFLLLFVEGLGVVDETLIEGDGFEPISRDDFYSIFMRLYYFI